MHVYQSANAQEQNCNLFTAENPGTFFVSSMGIKYSNIAKEESVMSQHWLR